MPARTVLILQHVEVEKPGLILEALTGHGLDVDIRHLGAPGALPAAAGLAGLVVMGGPMNADETDVHPGLKLERDLLAEAVRHGVPVLGICLGAQLLARALGLEVADRARTGRDTELGWAPLLDTDPADPVVGPLAGVPGVLHWHGDRIVPAADTAVLARTETTPCQAFRAGPAAWGLQFHLEVTPELLDEWLAEPSFAAEAEEALGAGALDRLRADARAAAPALRNAAARGLGHFRDLVLDRAGLPRPAGGAWVRPATGADATRLTELVRTSAAYAGAYAPMVERYEVTPGYVAQHEVHVAVAEDGRVLGFYGLVTDPPELDLMFVADDAQGLGIGRLLAGHMKERARAVGLTEVRVVSHPPSEGFYRSMGARRVGTVPPPSPEITWERPELVIPL
ncbi:GNAT family N-acetyltransferase [Streptomyces mashuensis]|uniref:GNAT family N-acetyltransferase n=1 Tax=Streptomyces mashuensis TaxID=33904 RepID=UPI00167EB7B2|nr:GNAT family N-acetyltransferase [Streptomyces mashuensis]